MRSAHLKCKSCGSKRLLRSHRRGSERVWSAVLPLRPYRCRDCDRRSWKRLSWGALPRQYALCLVLLGAMLLFVFIVYWFTSKSQDGRVGHDARSARDTSVITDVRQSPKSLLSVAQHTGAKTRALSALPIVHLELGFRVFPRVVEAPPASIQSRDGMRLSYPEW